MNNIVFINEGFITIGQLLKKVGLVDTGGQAKYYLTNNRVKINDKTPIGRNTKVFIGDVVWVNNLVYYIKEK
ncbi:RNA-binding S4 domain-containing protein [Mycoplasma zalophidermidis]|uniref:RNA-binding S4 domain-containing protein n=1 Tax=Mycoplasma zalophidermidis TaxID=398174 RepID=A0ABS6DR63_9MOLU|nr:RNA-binding S4 domain-containing protein [Mycoplasma zalophidermidis]MBU4689590.1 RNA-binding S4 domain-containing protein [Mycoplasma zalophidermidis]MBU4693488.1 RNA-binding S4 domain-containing protein [Mycoplasma zalophidermidis]MCR8966552.1 RNA-binding S4 domain-containing protein [Mycoplasma zalophidermidis]